MVTALVTIATVKVSIATRLKRVILAKIVTFSIEMWVLLVYPYKTERVFWCPVLVVVTRGDDEIARAFSVKCPSFRFLHCTVCINLKSV